MNNNRNKQQVWALWAEMIRGSILAFSLAFSLNAHGQTKIWNNWYFSYNAGLTFNTAPPSRLEGGLITSEGCATMSDKDGNLLFYSNGVTVWDNTHTPMPNGENLKGHWSAADGGLIVPVPKDNNCFYVFSVQQRYSEPRPLSYSVIDMTLNNGKGDVVEGKKNILLCNNIEESMSLVYGADESVFWLLVGEQKDDHFSFLMFKISTEGVDSTPVRSPIETGSSVPTHAGLYTVSHQSDKIASVLNDFQIGLFSINRKNGTISPIHIWQHTEHGEANPHFVKSEFSPNGEMLYFTTIYKGIYQFDISNNTIDNAITVLPKDNRFITLSLELGFDKKIYVCNYDNSRIGVIESPDRKGLDCNYVSDAIDISPSKTGSQFTPTYYYFSKNQINIRFNNSCINASVPFRVENLPADASVIWDFGDGTTSSETEPNHTYVAAGEYTVTVTISYADSTSETLWESITVYQKTETPAISYE